MWASAFRALTDIDVVCCPTRHELYLLSEPDIACCCFYLTLLNATGLQDLSARLTTAPLRL